MAGGRSKTPLGKAAEGVGKALNLGTMLRAMPNVPGIIGQKVVSTVEAFIRWAALTQPETEKLREFFRKLITLDELIDSVERIEALHSGDSAAVVRELIDWGGRTEIATDKATGQIRTRVGRYLIVRSPTVGVIDMKHFFSALAAAYDSVKLTLFGKQWEVGSSEGKALFLGLAMEFYQYYEGVKAVRTGNKERASWLESAFSAEDLVSNRLGAAMGQQFKGSKEKLSAALRKFLSKLQPLPTRTVADVKDMIRYERRPVVVAEALYALLRGLRSYVGGKP